MTKRYFSMSDAEAQFGVKNVVGDDYKVKRVVVPGAGTAKTRIVNKNGFIQTVEKKIGEVYGGAKNMASRGLEGTGNLGARATSATGRGAAATGGFVQRNADRLASAMRRNPKTAGAIILGGTLVGAGGGAYALSRRNQNN